MGKPMYRSLCFSIKDNKQIQVRRLTASVRLVKVREIPNCLAVYSRRHNTIITFLREDEYHERRNQQLREAAEGSGFNLESWLEQFDGDQGL